MADLPKSIVICADGTWNRPEKDLEEDEPTNVLKVARAINAEGPDNRKQVVYYDWGLGSYHSKLFGGAFGDGINKNIMDCYRFIVQNYDPGDDLYFFGFSRGAYTVRSLSGLLNQCGVLKRKYAHLIETAYEQYRDRDIHPNGEKAIKARKKFSVAPEVRIKFIGVWDTVGALGIPIRFFGNFDEEHLFHDTQIGPIVDCARHALALDEKRNDFEPTIWQKRPGLDLKQVWFAGVHSDVGGGYKPERGKERLSDIPLKWIMNEAEKWGLVFEAHLEKGLKIDALAKIHKSYTGYVKLRGKHIRGISKSKTFIHASVKERYERDSNYRPEGLVKFLKNNKKESKWPNLIS